MDYNTATRKLTLRMREAKVLQEARSIIADIARIVPDDTAFDADVFLAAIIAKYVVVQQVLPLEPHDETHIEETPEDKPSRRARA